MNKYEVVLCWSREDESFIADGPELPWCGADGLTRQEALANVEIVIAQWLKTASELGGEIPTPKGRLVFAQMSGLDRFLFAISHHQTWRLPSWRRSPKCREEWFKHM